MSAIAPSQRTMRTANFTSRCPSRCGACTRSNSKIRRSPNACSFLIAVKREHIEKKENYAYCYPNSPRAPRRT